MVQTILSSKFKPMKKLNIIRIRIRKMEHNSSIETQNQEQKFNLFLIEMVKYRNSATPFAFYYLHTDIFSRNANWDNSTKRGIQ